MRGNGGGVVGRGRRADWRRSCVGLASGGRGTRGVFAGGVLRGFGGEGREGCGHGCLGFR